MEWSYLLAENQQMLHFKKTGVNLRLGKMNKNKFRLICENVTDRAAIREDARATLRTHDASASWDRPWKMPRSTQRYRRDRVASTRRTGGYHIPCKSAGDPEIQFDVVRKGEGMKVHTLITDGGSLGYVGIGYRCSGNYGSSSSSCLILLMN